MSEKRKNPSLGELRDLAIEIGDIRTYFEMSDSAAIWDIERKRVAQIEGKLKTFSLGATAILKSMCHKIPSSKTNYNRYFKKVVK